MSTALKQTATIRRSPPPDRGVEAMGAGSTKALTGTLQGKKVWIDIDNSPHVPFFLPILDELHNLGCELLVTARNMYQVRELLDFFQLRCKVVGGHFGKNKVLKVLANCSRAIQLIPLAAKFRPDLAISHGSRAQVLACKALGFQTLMMHDYEHSIKTGFLESDWTLMPDVIPERAMTKALGRTLKYPGLKEDVYAPRLRPDPSVLRTLGISSDHLVVTLRPPATEAHYHHPESDTLFAATLRMLETKPNVRVVTLPRNGRQKKLIQEQWASLIRSGLMVIPGAALDGLNLIWFSDLVVSGGGTMNREAAALGVPVYSIFRGRIGAVDRWLAETGRLTLIESVEEIESKILLTRWDRPATPENIQRPALHSIVESLVSILEGRCRIHHSVR